MVIILQRGNKQNEENNEQSGVFSTYQVKSLSARKYPHGPERHTRVGEKKSFSVVLLPYSRYHAPEELGWSGSSQGPGKTTLHSPTCYLALGKSKESVPAASDHSHPPFPHLQASEALNLRTGLLFGQSPASIFCQCSSSLLCNILRELSLNLLQQGFFNMAIFSKKK